MPWKGRNCLRSSPTVTTTATIDTQCGSSSSGLCVLPYIDIEEINRFEPLADEIALTSDDFTHLMAAVSEQAGVVVREEDYPLVATLDGLEQYLNLRTASPTSQGDPSSKRPDIARSSIGQRVSHLRADPFELRVRAPAHGSPTSLIDRQHVSALVVDAADPSRVGVPSRHRRRRVVRVVLLVVVLVAIAGATASVWTYRRQIGSVLTHRKGSPTHTDVYRPFPPDDPPILR